MRAWGFHVTPSVVTASIAAMTLGCQVPPQEAFWERLGTLCDQAFAGHVTESSLPDSTLIGNRLLLYVRDCTETEIRIPFHVGDDRSRTWVVSRTANALRLKHLHAPEDGAPAAITDYGGETRSPGQPNRQEFPADSATARLLPAAARNVWTLELIPGETFAYSLRREGTDRRIRIEFDLGQAIPPPR